MTEAPAPPKAHTPEALLSEALGFTAPHTVTEVCAALPAETITNLVHAIDRRVYIATKQHDERVALAITSYMESQRETMRLRTTGWVPR